MHNINSHYLYGVLTPDDLEKSVNSVMTALTPIKDEFDCVVFKGMSGAMVGPIVAYLLKKHPVIIRRGEDSHSFLQVEGVFGLDSYIIVDDFINHGNTIRDIESKIRKHNKASYCVGVCLYNVSNIGIYANTIRFFRENCHLKWVPTGTFEDRTKAFLKWVENKNDDFFSQTLKQRVLGHSDHSIVSGLVAAFPIKKDREAFQSLPIWQKIESMMEKDDE